MYLFFDELQRINAWEEAVNSFRVDLDCDIYVTGSIAYLLSSEYSTYLSGPLRGDQNVAALIQGVSGFPQL